ncbi:MAG: hypothetical protein Q4E54_08550 [Lachnospiraceae bacterium]|nr:hypothetical protein [Lachnospiraceae bacterium]
METLKLEAKSIQELYDILSKVGKDVIIDVKIVTKEGGHATANRSE